MKQFQNILYVNEETVDQSSAVERAVSLAENNQAKLTIIDVIPPVNDDYQMETMNSHMQALEVLIEPYQNRMKIQLDVLMGKVFLEAIRSVLLNSYDLVIKAAENPDFMKRVFGSDDMHLLRKCPCPIWLMRQLEKSNYDCILAAVDFNLLDPTASEQALNLEILELASSLALSDFASLHMVHAWEAMAERVMLARGDIPNNTIATHVANQYSLHQKGLYRLGETLREGIGTDAYDIISPRSHLPKGPAKKVIVTLAEQLQADLVVMGTVARTGISGLIIGNTAEAILGQLSCSVLAIKPPGFKTPVKLTE
ncbi:MAG: universal stress protein [Desulfobacterales bacterium]|jgi:nucleotide-binding universal stress UspA family protein|nr:universal stress protein [Desulfobacterales bacterium]